VRALMPGVAEEVYRIGREALGNSFRHANASAVEAQFIYGDDEFSLRVRDDGQGIDVGTLEADSTPGHWGLTGMRERAGLIGARLDIWSRDGAGTEIELRVPARLAYPPRRGQLWRLRVLRALRI
jgi:signal transduction histidine kinase